MSPGLSAQSEIARRLQRVRRRAVARGAVRGGLVGLCAAALVLLLAALWVGAVVAPVTSVLVALIAAGSLGACLWFVARPDLEPSRAANLLDASAPGLGSRVLSAVEFSHATPMGSPELISAHAEQTLSQLRTLPPEQVVPFDWRADRQLKVAALVLLGLSIAGFNERVQRGLDALVHPSSRDATGARSGDVVEHVDIVLHFPAYLARADERLRDVSRVDVPRGTNIEFSVVARVDADAAELRVANVEVPLQATSETREFRGSFVARDSGPIEVRLHSGDGWLKDRTARSLVTQADSAPTISIATPIDGTVMAPDAAFELGYNASDDAGLMTVEFIFRAPDGRETRRRIWNAAANNTPQLTLTERITVLAADLMAKPGDVIALWLEATDRSTFDGTNRSRSAVVHVEIASDAGEKTQLREALRVVLDRMLDALADRLEQAISDDEQRARERANALFDKAVLFLDGLDHWIETARSTDAITRLDQDAVRAIRVRHRRLLAEEQAQHGDHIAAINTRTATDRRATEALEGDSLFVADLLGRTHLAEAEALAAELAQIRKQLSELMKKLESTDDAQARKDMLATISRARARLARLMQSLAAMADHVPSEFVNADALRSRAASDALSSMADALQNNDLKTAEEQLAELTRDVDQLQQSLRDGTMSFTNERFGERNRAMAAARSELAALSEEQERLAQRSGRVMQRLGERWSQQHGLDPKTPALQGKAKAAREALDSIDRSTLGGLETQALDRVSQRLSDSAAAIGSGDLLGAEQMAGMASEGAQELERDLDIMRRMFPGARGEASNNAQQAKRARSAIDGLRAALSQQAPDVAGAMNATDERELHGDADPQKNVREGTGRLAQSLESGPEGAAVHNQGAQALRNAERAMQRAEQALRRGDPQGASAGQSDARDALEAARESMREDGGKQRGAGEPQSGDGDGNDVTGGHVRIPDARSSAAQALRQKLIEGMREARPAGYESEVERYYRELLE